MKKNTIFIFLLLSFILSGKLSAQNVQLRLLESWNGASWDSTTRFVYSYDANSYLLSQSIDNFNGSSWLNNTLNTYTSDVIGNQTISIRQIWSVASNSWQNSVRTTNTFSLNKIISSTIEYWISNAWSNSTRVTNTYDANLNMISELQENANGFLWQNASLTSYSNNASGQPTLALGQTWSVSTNAWTNSTKNTLTYQSNKLSTNISQNWDGSTWKNSIQFNYTYDSNMNLISQLIQTSSGTSWDNLSQYTYTNNVNGNPLIMVYESWNNSSWRLNQRSIYTYSNSIVSIPSFAKYLTYKVFPVPATDMLYIHLDENSGLDFQIVDLIGKVILQIRLTKENNSIDINSLDKGVYFLISLKGEAIKIIKD